MAEAVLRTQNLKRRATDEIYDTPVALVLSARILVSMLIFLSVLLYQGMQKEFVNPSLLYPAYTVLGISSLFNLALIHGWSHEGGRAWILRATLYSEVVLISCLIFFSGVHYSVFVFLYLLNLVGSGLVLGRDEAMRVVLFTTLCFNFVYILGSEVSRQSFFFVIIFNNLAFFGVAWLSGYLHDQIHSLGGMVRDRGREISQLKNMNRIIVSSIPSGLALIDVDGRLQYMNESFKEMVDGMSLVGGDSLWMVLPKLENRLKAYSSGGNSQVSRIEYKFNDSGEKKDRGRSLEILISPVQSREAGFTGYLLILQDLTDVKLLEQSLRQSEKLAAIGQLAAGIAHEIRNPLASISGSVQMLKALLRGDSNEDEAKLMAIVIREIDRLNLLIGEFLDYSRPDNRITEKVNLSELVIEIARLVALNDRLPKGIATHLDVEPDCFILADSGKLKQAVMNIVINAYQSFEGIGPGTIAIVLKRTGDRIKLSISDNGCGISTQELTRIFDPFHTTKNNGTGLGLAITHKILKNHRALVDVRSRIDEGTEFVIEIPPFVELSESAV